MKKLLLVIVLAGWLAAPALFSQELAGSLSNSGLVFGSSTPPAHLDSQRDWILLGPMDWSLITENKAPYGFTRKWRLRSSYEHEAAGGPSTLQVRLENGIDWALFTHPWTEGPDRRIEAYSNWYIPGSPESMAMQEGGYLKARLIAPPRTPLKGRIHSVTLEVWDVPGEMTAQSPPPAPPQVELASAAPVSPPGQQQFFQQPSPPKKQAHSKEDALDFALAFLNTCLGGDLPSFYRSLAVSVRSLDDGKAIPKYQVPPPQALPGAADLRAYRERYSYRIYSAREYKELFPHWFDSSRPWIPQDDHYLFWGQERKGNQDFNSNVSYLVFMVAPRPEGGWSVIARPGT